MLIKFRLKIEVAPTIKIYPISAILKLHKLKGWARDNIGSSMSVNQRVAAINDQIGTFVLDTPKPRAELLRTRPLSTGFCEIFDDPDITRDSYRLTFRLHEHRNYPVGELTTHIGMG